VFGFVTVHPIWKVVPTAASSASIRASFIFSVNRNPFFREGYLGRNAAKPDGTLKLAEGVAS